MGDRESLDRSWGRRVHARPHRARPANARLRLLRGRAERAARRASAGHGDLRGLADAALPHRPRVVRGPRHHGRTGGRAPRPRLAALVGAGAAGDRARRRRFRGHGAPGVPPPDPRARCSRRRRAMGSRRATASSGPSSPEPLERIARDGAATIYSGEVARELRARSSRDHGRGPRELPRDPSQAATRALPRRGVRLEPAAVLRRCPDCVRAAAARGAGARRLARRASRCSPT